ncbi:MAG: hypothetical protein NZ735_06110 [Candidatus Marinimicrobia bacterium]|nr:hypothetical protein [Candidatus Neomarinimicrobiota bacterium]
MSDNNFIDISISSYFFFPIGACVFCWVVYGKQSLPGQILILILMSIYWELELPISIRYVLISVFVPVLTIYIFRKLHIFEFKNFRNESIMGIFLMCLVLAFISSLTKFFFAIFGHCTEAFCPFGSIISEGGVNFLLNSLSGDLIGSFSFILIVIWLSRMFHLGDYRN